MHLLISVQPIDIYLILFTFFLNKKNAIFLNFFKLIHISTALKLQTQHAKKILKNYNFFK